MLKEEEEEEGDDGVAQIVVGWDDYDSQTANLLKEVDVVRRRHEYAWKSARANGHTSAFLVETVQNVFSSAMKQDDGLYNGTYVDCTFGRGGHSIEILRRLSEGGRLFAFDIDPDAARAGKALEAREPRFKFFPHPFAELAEHLNGTEVHGILFDVGVSSPQLDRRQRGFSLNNLADHKHSPLDLRMNPGAGISAEEWLRNVTAAELAWTFRNDVSGHPSVWMERLAQDIVDHRDTVGPFTNMRDFAGVAGRTILQMWGREDDFEHPSIGKDHPAKLFVAAIRSFLNQEILQLDRGIKAAFEVATINGRVVVATFRNKEVEHVLALIADHEEPDLGTVKRLKARRLRELYPLVGTALGYSVKVLGDLRISQSESTKNPRTRSGRLFVMEKAPRITRQVKSKPRSDGTRLQEPHGLDFERWYPSAEEVEADAGDPSEATPTKRAAKAKKKAAGTVKGSEPAKKATKAKATKAKATKAKATEAKATKAKATKAKATKAKATEAKATKAKATKAKATKAKAAEAKATEAKATKAKATEAKATKAKATKAKATEAKAAEAKATKAKAKGGRATKAKK